MKKFLRLLGEMAALYNEKRVTKASAALSYYLTMTLFPLIICLYALLGENYYQALQVLDFLERFLSAETIRVLRSFLLHLSINSNRAILAAGLTILISSSSAAVRTLQSTIGEMQGGQRYRGLSDILFSLLFSVVFIAAMYFAILVMLTGKDILGLINSYLPFVDVSRSWQWLRFLLLGGIEFLILWGIYLASRRSKDRYRCYPGAILSMLAMVVVSYLFSICIAASTRYPLVYGSLASLILLMFWLYLCCQVIFVGAAFNIALRDQFTSQ